jgi:hypothetical protein
MGQYDDERQDAFDQIKEAGGPIKIRAKGTNVPVDAAKPWRGNAPTPTDHDTFGVHFPYAPETPRYGSEQWLIPCLNLGVELSREMRIIDAAGVSWSIDDFELIAPNSVEPIMYEVRASLWPQH